MLLEAAHLKTKQLIFSGAKHIDYDRTVLIDQDALTYTSGEDIGRLLIQILKRESAEAFKQRIALTCGITAELFGGLEAPINDVVQNDMVRKGIRLDNERQRLNIEEMFKYWNGSMFNKSNGFDNWLKTRFKDLQGAGPNTWIVAEWSTPASPTEVIRPQPFEVPAANAHNWEIKNNSLIWFMACQPITYLKKKKAEDIQKPSTTHVETPAGYVPPFPLPEYLQHTAQEGNRYTMYTSTHAIVYEQVDRDYYELQPGDLSFIEIKSNRWYVVREYQHKLGFVPAFRVGYMDDPKTAGRTKVPFWHRAKNTFRKSLMTGSNMDISETVQNFPRPTRYVTQCMGDGVHQCRQGWQAGNTAIRCTACKDTPGMQTITTPMEEIVIPLPVEATNDQLLDLSKLEHWSAPPKDILEHMRTVVEALEPRAHKAVWGTEMLIRKEQTTKTATEDDNDQKRLQTALEPFAEKISEVYRFVGYLFGALAGADVNKMDIFYEFQGDLYKKGEAQLIAQIKTATDAGAPTFIIRQINETLADIKFAGDPYGRQQIRVQEYFWPFPGKSNEQIEFLFSSDLVEQFDKVLFTYFDAIFKELELDNVDFYYMTDKNKQWDLVIAKVDEFIQRKKDETPEPVLPKLPTIPIEDVVTD